MERNNVEVLSRYLEDQLPGITSHGAFQEWRTHVTDTLSGLRTAKRGGGASQEKQFVMTFLDKWTELVRALHFADAQRCCFNSTNAGTIPKPEGYEAVRNLPLTAIRAINETRVYDDIGTVANGDLSFSGYLRRF